MNATLRFCLLFLLLPVCARGQVCNGVPGDTLVLLSFGSGDNPGPALPVGTTTYNYGSIGGGNYVVTNTSGVNGGLWHHAPDHSDDDKGYMLLFDASSAPGIFFQTIVDGLCSNTTYEFGCWATNIVVPSACSGSSIQPNITFEVRDPFSNALLASVSTGPIPTSATSTWDDYGVTFMLPANLSSVKVVMVNNAPGGCGNDLAIDDIIFRVCNPFYVQNKSICTGDTVFVGNHAYTEPGVYQDEFAVPGTCNDSILYTVIKTGGTFEIPQSYTICAGEQIEVNGHIYANAGTYQDTLFATNGALCDTVLVTELILTEFFRDTQQVAICFGEEYFINGHLYSLPGLYTDTLEVPGCDKIQVSIISLTDLPFQFQNRVICANDSLIVGNSVYSSSGFYVDTLSMPGCDLIMYTKLEVKNFPPDTQWVKVCPGESLMVGSHAYSLPGVYTDTLYSSECDSVVVTFLSYADLPEQEKHYDFCKGEGIVILGKLYQTQGIYRDTLVQPGCDTVYVLHLTEHEKDRIEQEHYLCLGETFSVGVHAYSQDGIYTDTLQNRFGCDSIVQTTLHFGTLQVDITPESASIEMGDPLNLSANLQHNLPVYPQWLWSPPLGLSCIDCPNPVLNTLQSQGYKVFVEDTLTGCVAMDSIFVVVLPCKKLYIPNVFKPDSDTENAWFTLYAATCVRLIKRLQVYDRWGDLIFERRDFPPNQGKLGWDGQSAKGKAAPSGVYCYLFNVELLDGKDLLLYGDVSIIR